MASGDSLLAFGALESSPPASNYATLDVRNNRPVADFDAGVEETLFFQSVLPRHYAGGGITVSLHGMASAATSGDVKLGVAFERTQAGGSDLDADDFAAEKTVTVTADGVSGKVFSGTIAFGSGEIDGVQGGEPFRLRVARKAADAADTMTGDYELLAIELKES